MPEPTVIIYIIVCFVLFACNWSFLRMSTIIWKPKAKSIYIPCVVGSAVFAAYAVSSSIWIHNEPVIYLLDLLLCYVMMRLLFRLSSNEAIWASCFFVFNTICCKGIILGVLSLVLGKNIYQVLSIPFYSLLAIAIAGILKAMFLQFYRTVIPIPMTRFFLSCEKEVQDMLKQHTFLVLFMLFHCYNYAYNLDLIWFSMAQIITSVLMLVMYMWILSYGTQVANLMQKDMWNQKLTEQMQVRLAQHKRYNTTLEDMSDFSKQYQILVGNAQQHLKRQEQDKLADILMNKMPRLAQAIPTIPAIQQFSNEPGCDAVLFEWRNICVEEQIAFDALLFIPTPNNIRPDLLHHILQFLNDLHTPLAKGVQNKRESTISIEAKVTNSWLSIKSTSSFRGKIDMQNELPYFILDDALRLKSIYHRLREFVTSNQGMVSCSSDNSKKQFSIIISLYCGK